MQRVAKRELGIEVQELAQQNYIEYPSHYLNGIDTPIGIAFEVLSFSGVPQVNKEAVEGGWFDKLPQPMHADVDEFLVRHGYASIQ